MNMPLVSVVIPNYNYGRYLEAAIESVLCQTYSNIELIVIDDGSTDESEQVLMKYEGRLRWYKQQNKGVSSARNYGVSVSRGEFVAFLDSDDQWVPEKVQKQMHILMTRPEIGLVHCGYAEIDREGKTGSEILQGMEGWVAEDLLKLQKHVIGSPGTIVCRRSVFEEVGYFDSDLPPCEDWEWAFRVAKYCPVGFIREPLLLYRIHGANSHLNIQRLDYGMMRAFEKVFLNTDPYLRQIRKKCYGKLHSILAGSYFRSGDMKGFIRHTLKGMRYSPDSLTRLAGYPLRQLKKLY